MLTQEMIDELREMEGKCSTMMHAGEKGASIRFMCELRANASDLLDLASEALRLSALEEAKQGICTCPADYRKEGFIKIGCPRHTPKW